jgi:Tfp pilus assembly protein PilO
MKKIKLKELVPEIGKKVNFQELSTKIIQDKNKLILAIVAVVIILYLDISFGIKSQLRALRAVTPKIVRLKTDLKNLNADLVRMQRQEAGFAIDQIKELVSPGQLAGLIEEISSLANQKDVRISKIKPVRRQSEEVDSRPLLDEDYSLALIELEVFSGYHQLGRFLSDLESHSVFLEITDLDIRQTKEDPFEHKIKLKLKTYVQSKK